MGLCLQRHGQCAVRFLMALLLLLLLLLLARLRAGLACTSRTTPPMTNTDITDMIRNAWPSVARHVRVCELLHCSVRLDVLHTF
jgi:hypothetical protein